MDPFGSLVKLGKMTPVEERHLTVYIKGMNVLKQRYFYCRDIISGKIRIDGNDGNIQKRAETVLSILHNRACKIKQNFKTLISVKIPQRYKNDIERLFELQKKGKENEFMKQYTDGALSFHYVFENMGNSIVSDCEMLGFCVCGEYNIPPYMYGCMEKGRDILMLDNVEE